MLGVKTEDGDCALCEKKKLGWIWVFYLVLVGLGRKCADWHMEPIKGEKNSGVVRRFLLSFFRFFGCFLIKLVISFWKEVGFEN